MEHGANVTGLENAEAFLKVMASWAALGLEIVACLVIIVAAVGAIRTLLTVPHDPRRPFWRRRQVFLGFGSWLILALEFELGADIVRSAISPTWQQIGTLAAVAAIRTFLNYFLERDVDKMAEGIGEAPEAEAANAPETKSHALKERTPQ